MRRYFMYMANSRKAIMPRPCDDCCDGSTSSCDDEGILKKKSIGKKRWRAGYDPTKPTEPKPSKSLSKFWAE